MCQEFLVTSQVRKARLHAHGKVQALQSSNLSTEIPGRVKARHIQAGDHVKEGEVLIELDHGALESQLQVLEWDSKENQLSQEYHQKRLQRRRSNPKAYTQEEIQTEEFTLDRLKSVAGKIEAKIKELHRKLGTANIKAPFEGIISKHFVELGEWVSPGQPICTLLSLDGTLMELEVSRRFFKKVQNGDRLEIHLPGKSVPGRVIRKIPMVNEHLGTHPLRIQLPMKIGEVSHGEILPVSISYQEEVLRIPAAYTKPVGKTFRVVVFEPGGLKELHVDGQMEGLFFIPFDRALKGKILQKIEK